MKTIIVLFVTLTIASAGFGKPTRWDGLDGLNIQNFYGSTSYQMTEIYENNGCDVNQCINNQTSNVHQVSYEDGSNVMLCMCPEAVIDKDEIAYNFGYVPVFIRRWTEYLTSGSPGICTNTGNAAYSTGVSTTYCISGMPQSVYVHEATHNYDMTSDSSGLLSSRPQWQEAVNNDFCVPDIYADTDLSNDFAQVAVVWMYISAVSDDISCMQNQMDTFMEWIH